MEACVWHVRTQTWLMQKLGLKASVLKDALNFLTANQLLEEQPEPEVGIYEFKTTNKGQDALKKYLELVEHYFSKKVKITA